MGRSTWRSLHSVMLVTLHVAVIASVLRTLSGPTTLAGSLLVWVPLTIAVAVFLSWPLGRAFATAFQPDATSGLSGCRECGNFELRPLLRPGSGLFQPVVGYRCLRCGATHRPVEGTIAVERLTHDPGPCDLSGIEFLIEPSRPEEREEIRFLDEDPA